MRLDDHVYEHINQVVSDLYKERSITSIPIDVYELADKMCARITKESDIRRKNGITGYVKTSKPEAYFFYNPDEICWEIYINDCGLYKTREKFSAAHELMHIALGHTKQNEREEAMANFGARYLLAPTCLILVEDVSEYLLDPMIVEKCFGLSKEAARIAVNAFRKRAELSAKPKDYERTLIDLLANPLREKIKEIVSNKNLESLQ